MSLDEHGFLQLGTDTEAQRPQKEGRQNQSAPTAMRHRFRQAWSRCVNDLSQSTERLDAPMEHGGAETVVASGATVDALKCSYQGKMQSFAGSRMEACIGTLEHEHVAYPEDDPHNRAPARAAFVIGKGITWDVWLDDCHRPSINM